MRPLNEADAATHAGADAPDDHLSTVRAVRLFFQPRTHLTTAQFREQRFRGHCLGQKDGPVECKIRLDAFRQEYAATVGEIVVEEGRFRAAA